MQLRPIQCDEERPNCQRCKARGIECGYSSESDDAGNDTKKLIASTPNATISSLAIEDITKSIQTTLSLDPDWSPYALMNKNSDHPLSTVAFQHFVKSSTDTVVVPAIRNVMRTDMIRVAFTVSIISTIEHYLYKHSNSNDRVLT